MSSSTYIQLYNLRRGSALADFLTELEELLTFYEYPECLVMEEECAICAEHHGQSKIQVPCGHIFHTDCLITWLQECQNNSRHGTCPMCRGLFWVQDEYEVVYEPVAATFLARHLDDFPILDGLPRFQQEMVTAPMPFRPGLQFLLGGVLSLPVDEFLPNQESREVNLRPESDEGPSDRVSTASVDASVPLDQEMSTRVNEVPPYCPRCQGECRLPRLLV